MKKEKGKYWENREKEQIKIGMKKEQNEVEIKEI